MDKSIYIEFIGNSGVGKSTIQNLTLSKIIKNDNTLIKQRVSKLNIFVNIYDTLKYKWRLKCMIRLSKYLYYERSASLIQAITRSAFITGRPAHKTKLAQKKNIVLSISEGPVGYITSVGISGQDWQEFTKILMPEAKETVALYIYLTASDRIRKQRQRLRNRIRKKKYLRTGKEGVSKIQRHRARQYWLAELEKNGAYVMEISTDDMSKEEISDLIANKIKFIIQ